MTRILRYLTFQGLFLSMLLFFSCTNEKQQNYELEEDNVNVEEVEDLSERLFYAIPSPVEIALLFKKEGATYDIEFTNPVENTSKYVTTSSQALNMGVYGADLSYASVFNQTQETLFFMKAAKKMADELGLTSAFPQEKVEAIEENIHNQDTLLELIADAFWTSDAELKETERESFSGLIIAGGWIEAVYLGVVLYHDGDAKTGIRKRIAEQKFSLENLIKLLGIYHRDETVVALREDLEDILEAYKMVSEEKKAAKVSENKNGSLTIGGGSKFSLSDEAFATISEKIIELRMRIIE